jgi:hypothetical protein
MVELLFERVELRHFEYQVLLIGLNLEVLAHRCCAGDRHERSRDEPRSKHVLHALPSFLSASNSSTARQGFRHRQAAHPAVANRLHLMCDVF